MSDCSRNAFKIPSDPTCKWRSVYTTSIGFSKYEADCGKQFHTDMPLVMYLEPCPGCGRKVEMVD